MVAAMNSDTNCRPGGGRALPTDAAARRSGDSPERSKELLEQQDFYASTVV